MVATMQKALNNMWAMNIILTLINVYSLLYSVVKFIAWGNEDCHSSITFVYNSNTIINRLVTYIVWVAPIVYIFWPQTRNIFCCNRQKRTKESGEEEFVPTGLDNDRSTATSAVKDDSDSDIEGEGSFHASSNSKAFKIMKAQNN